MRKNPTLICALIMKWLWLIDGIMKPYELIIKEENGSLASDASRGSLKCGEWFKGEVLDRLLDHRLAFN